MLAVFFSRAEGGQSFPTRIVMGIMMLLALALAFGALLPELNFDSLSLNSRDRWMAQLLYDKHRPSTLLLAIGTAGMLAFCYALVLHKNSGMKISGIIAGWAFLLYLGVHGPAARMVNEHTSFRPFAEKLKQISENRPLFNYGKVREDLLYYLDSPITEVSGNPLSQQPNAMLLIKKSQSQAWLKKYSDQKVLLEMNAAFEPYQLIGRTQ